VECYEYQGKTATGGPPQRPYASYQSWRSESKVWRSRPSTRFAGSPRRGRCNLRVPDGSPCVAHPPQVFIRGAGPWGLPGESELLKIKLIPGVAPAKSPESPDVYKGGRPPNMIRMTITATAGATCPFCAGRARV